MKKAVFQKTEGYKCQRFSLSLKIWILHSDFKVKNIWGLLPIS